MTSKPQNKTRAERCNQQEQIGHKQHAKEFESKEKFFGEIAVKSNTKRYGAVCQDTKAFGEDNPVRACKGRGTMRNKVIVMEFSSFYQDDIVLIGLRDF